MNQLDDKLFISSESWLPGSYVVNTQEQLLKYIQSDENLL